jgi:hypothetical protein
MDPSDGHYGWAADDPRWTDAQTGGRGRLEPPVPPVPNFGDADTIVTGAVPPVPSAPTVPHYTPPTGLSSSGGVRTGYGLSGGAGPVPHLDRGGPPAVRPHNGAAPAHLTPPVSRLDRARARARRRADDEFRRAGRAELFSDDARYGVLVALTALWYAPVGVLFALGVLLGLGGGPIGPRLFVGLLWLVAAAALSDGVVGLLRWARVGWRALTLTIAAALIGGGVATVAHTLSS